MATVAFLALQNWGCSDSKPLWSRLFIPIRSPHQRMKLSKCDNFVTQHQLQCKQISDSQSFRSTQQSNIIHSDSLSVESCETGGAKPKKLGVQLHRLLQRRTTTSLQEISLKLRRFKSDPDEIL